MPNGHLACSGAPVENNPVSPKCNALFLKVVINRMTRGKIYPDLYEIFEDR